MSDEEMSLEEEYRRAVVKLARFMPELIDEMRLLRGAIDRMPRGR
ncbi:unnamed protein product [marine sediment metagenome]|uniref:Uncharacterized protein n=1 Tax=marine sediment metagenome TaxID=412755 RepID=X1GR19_9ZZZZ